jgi:hypothetical protein
MGGQMAEQLRLGGSAPATTPSVTHWYCALCGTRYRTRHRRSPTRRRYRERMGVCRICTRGMQLLLAQHRDNPIGFLRALGQGARVGA